MVNVSKLPALVLLTPYLIDCPLGFFHDITGKGLPVARQCRITIWLFQEGAFSNVDGATSTEGRSGDFNKKLKYLYLDQYKQLQNVFVGLVDIFLL